MLHLLGVNLPDKKLVPVALSYFYGIGRPLGEKICHQLSIHPQCHLQDLTDAKINQLSEVLNKMVIEGDLRRQVQNRILHHRSIGTVTGKRFELGLPVRGQRTRSNAKTAFKLNRRWLAKDFSTIASASLIPPFVTAPIAASHQIPRPIMTRLMYMLKRVL